MRARLLAILLAAAWFPSGAAAESPPGNPCAKPDHARRNLALFEAIEGRDADRIRNAIAQGADLNCPFPVLQADGSYDLPLSFDVPLYRAAKDADSNEIFALLAGAGARPETRIPDAGDELAVSAAFFPYYASLGGADYESAKKVAPSDAPAVPASAESEFSASIRDLTSDEIRKATPDPDATDPWSVLARQAPLQSHRIGGEHLGSVLEYATSASEWSYRANLIRQGILEGAELLLPPPKTPLNPIINELKTRDGYTIQNVAFEATPGFFVTGNLFTPTSGTGPYPAILLSHGHFGPWGGYARTLPENQILATRLAQMGAVVFTWDMVGWGDAQQLDHADSYGFWGFGDENHFKDGSKNNLLALQLWNGIRSLDFITSLTAADGSLLVNPQRIGVTGASGGATQSLYLAAIDPRVGAAALVVMITAGYTGDDHCEDGMPVHRVSGERKTNNTEIAATLAPRPVLILSDGKDWTQWFPEDEYPYLKRVWGYFSLPERNADNQVLNFHFPHEGHDYGPSKRAPAYAFFRAAFGLTAVPNTGSGQDGNIEGVPLESRDSLQVFTPEHPRPPFPRDPHSGVLAA